MLNEKVHFLLVIDNKADALLVESAIKKVVEGEFFIVNTFKKAEEHILNHKVDVIISALQLQDRDAIDFIYALKTQSKKHYYIIFNEKNGNDQLPQKISAEDRLEIRFFRHTKKPRFLFLS